MQEGNSNTSSKKALLEGLSGRVVYQESDSLNKSGVEDSGFITIGANVKKQR